MTAVHLREEPVGSWQDGIITEGFKQQGYIRASEGQYPELRYVFTPMFPEDVEHVNDQIQKKSSENIKEVIYEMAKVLSAQIHSWSFGEGKPTVQILRRMRYAQMNKLYKQVTGLIPIDSDPKTQSDAKLPEFEPLTETLGK